MTEAKKPRCPDVAEAIINHLRNECAVSTSNGLETNSDKLAKAIGVSQAATAAHLRRLIDLGIIFTPIGTYEQGNTGPKSFALKEEHEEGDDWKTIYYGSNSNGSNQKIAAPLPTLTSDLIKHNAKAAEEKNLLQELVQAYTRINELQEKIIAVQNERNEALEKVEKQRTRIVELEQDLKLEAETAQKSQQELTTLELQLREARSQVAHYDRRITKNDERPQTAFAHR